MHANACHMKSWQPMRPIRERVPVGSHGRYSAMSLAAFLRRKTRPSLRSFRILSTRMFCSEPPLPAGVVGPVSLSIESSEKGMDAGTSIKNHPRRYLLQIFLAERTSFPLSEYVVKKLSSTSARKKTSPKRSMAKRTLLSSMKAPKPMSNGAWMMEMRMSTLETRSHVWRAG